MAKYHAAHLPKVCGVKRRALERFFHDTLTLPPQPWLNQIRQMDAETLAHSDKPIKEMAGLLGYKQPSHFCRQFKKARGMSVKLWKNLAARFYGFSPKRVPQKSPQKPVGRKKCRVAGR